jgi:hypothetical protein
VTVKIACILTWVFSGVVALTYVAMLVILIAAHDRIVDYVLKSPEWQRSHLNQDLLMPVLWIGCLMFLGWSLGACLLAWFTWRRHNWARWLLATSAAAALVAAFFAFPIGVLHQLAAILTILGLFSAGSRAWFATQPWPPGGPPFGPPPPGVPHDSLHEWPPSQPGPDQERAPAEGKPPVW